MLCDVTLVHSGKKKTSTFEFLGNKLLERAESFGGAFLPILTNRLKLTEATVGLRVTDMLAITGEAKLHTVGVTANSILRLTG